MFFVVVGTLQALLKDVLNLEAVTKHRAFATNILDSIPLVGMNHSEGMR